MVFAITRNLRRTLAVHLRPWRDVFDSSIVRCIAKEGDDVAIVVTIQLYLTAEMVASANPIDAQRRLREAIVLLRMVVALDVTLLTQLRRNRWFRGINISSRAAERSSSASTSSDSFCIRFIDSGVHAERLVAWVEDGILAAFRAGSVSEDTAFQVVSTELEELLRRAKMSYCFRPPRHVKLSSRLPSSVHLSCEIQTPKGVDFGPMDAEDYFVHLAHLAQSLQRVPSPSAVIATVDATFPPAIITVEPLCLSISSLHITRRVVKALQVFANVDVKFECSHVPLDPRQIPCSTDLQGFRQVVASMTPSLNIVMTHGATVDFIDGGGEDRTDLIHSIFHAIASCSNVGRLDIGNLLAACSHEINRTKIYYEMMDCVLSGPNKVHQLIFDPDVDLEQDDTACLRQAIDNWRADNPGKTLRGRGLQIGWDGAVSVRLQFVRTFIDMLDDVEELSLGGSKSERLPSDLVEMILRKFPSLQKLSLSNVMIESMEIFLHRKLRAITLSNFVLQRPASLFVFLDALKTETSCPLASRLYKLGIDQKSAPDVFTLSKEAAELLDEVLEVNSVLCQVKCTLTKPPDEPAWQRMRLAARLDDHREEVVAWHDVKGRVQRRAFLSVITGSRGSTVGSAAPAARYALDTDTTRRIFEFSVPTTKRSVRAVFFGANDEQGR